MSLLNLKIASRDVSLPEDFVIRLTFKMPLPYLENIPTALTYWFSLPSNKVNDRIFKHANHVCSSKKLRVYDCLLDVANLQMKGRLYLKNANIRQYKAFIVFNDLIEELSTKKLSSIINHSYFMGNNADEIIAEMYRMQNLTWPAVPYGFPSIINKDFFGGNEEHFSGIMNYYFDGGDKYYKNYYDKQNDVTYNRTVMVPQPYLLAVLKEALISENFELSGSVINDPSFRKLLLYSNNAVQNISDDDYVYVKNTQQWMFTFTTSDNLVEFDQIVKDDDACFGLFNKLYQPSKPGHYRVKFRCKAYFNDMPSSFPLEIKLFDDGTWVNVGNITLQIGKIHEVDFDVIVWLNSTRISLQANSGNAGQTVFLDTEYEIFPVDNFNADMFGSVVEMKHQVPDITLSKFINGMAKTFCLASFFDFKTRDFELVKWSEIINSSKYLDLSHYLIKDSEDISLEEKKFSFKMAWDNDSLVDGNFTVENTDGLLIANTLQESYPRPGMVWQKLLIAPVNLVYRGEINNEGLLDWVYDSDYFQNIIDENIDTESLDIPISSLFVRDSERVIFDVHYNQYLPAINQPGSNHLCGENEPGFKVYNNHGIVSVDSYYRNATLPFASNSKFDYDGNDIGGYNMNIDGQDGLYNTLHRELYDYIASRNLIEMEFDMVDSIFHKLIALYKANQNTRKVRVGARNYLPEMLDVSIGLNGFKSCKMNLR